MGAQKITEDQERFKKIVRGKVRKNLSKHMSDPYQIIRKRGKKIAVPMPQINTPRFRFDDKQKGGVGRGDGEIGDPLGPSEGDGDNEAGDQPGEHAQEVEFTIEEFIDIVAEELELPNLDESGRKRLIHIKDRYTGIRKVGPEGLRHPRRTLKEALKRTIASGEYNLAKPKIIPVKDDRRYRSAKPVIKEQSEAVIIYMIDVSGSMGKEEKYMARLISFWIDLWVARNYNGLDRRFIIHDTKAQEVDRETFFSTTESGGTMISSAYELCSEIIDEDYPPSEVNIYPIHFSDGDNWGNDNNKAIQFLREKILVDSNMFSFVQVGDSGKFRRIIEGEFWINFSNEELGEKLRTSHMKTRDDTMKVMKDIFGKR